MGQRQEQPNIIQKKVAVDLCIELLLSLDFEQESRRDLRREDAVIPLYELQQELARDIRNEDVDLHKRQMWGLMRERRLPNWIMRALLKVLGNYEHDALY